MKPKINVEAAKSTLRAAGSSALAQAVVCGIDEVRENGGTITQTDEIHLVKMAIMAYDEILQACSSLDIEISLQQMRDLDEQ